MKKGVKTLITGIGLLVFGTILVPVTIALVLALQFFTAQSEQIQFPVPGSQQMTIEKPGRYYLWNHYQTFFQGESYNKPETIPDGVIVLFHDASGNKLAFHPNGSITSTVGSQKKKSVGYVDVKVPGDIAITVTGEMDERIFSFSQFEFFKLLAPILLSTLFSMVCYFSGLGFIIWGVTKFNRLG